LNFLAHLLLAGDDPGRRVGGLAADFLRGVAVADLPADLHAGVEFHWRLDHYTDTHPVFRRTRRRLHESFGHFAGVVADVAYDHVLAHDFSRWSNVALRDFSRAVFALLEHRDAELPEGLRRAWPAMRRADLFMSYRTWGGVEAALVRLSRRARRGGRLRAGLPLRAAEKEAIEHDFDEFFPQVRAWSRERQGLLPDPLLP
jgi:acyl carrier protein phosphodiesterase